MTHALQPLWHPSFISKFVREGCCELEGLAMEGERARYVTAFSATDVFEGWRERRANGRMLIDVASDRAVAEGLSQLSGNTVELSDVAVIAMMRCPAALGPGSPE